MKAPGGDPLDWLGQKWKGPEGACSERRRLVWGSVLIGFAGFAVLSSVLLAAGFAITRSLPTVRAWDGDVSQWFAAGRTPTLNTLTAIGTLLAETPVVVIAGAGLAVGLARTRHRPLAVLVVTALVLEITVFLTVNLTVDRPRPAHGLESRSTSSFPSGHVTASVVLYVVVAIVVTALTADLPARRTAWRAARRTAWAVALAAPLIVAVSRVYRGEHHVSDVVAGLVTGSACVTIAFVAVRHAYAPAGGDSVLARRKNGRETELVGAA